MEKLIFLFGRKPGLSHDEFARHYLDVHAPLGRRVTRAMAGYVVNLVEDVDASDAGLPELDAITEIWTPSVDEFFDPTRAFTSAEDGRELMADHESFIGPMHAYVVSEAVAPTASAPPPGAKCFSLVRRGEGGAPNDAGDVVTRVLTPDSPTLDRIVTSRAPSIAAVRSPRGIATYLVTEHVMLAPSG